MTDLCKIERDEEGTSDDTIDPDTLELSQPDPDFVKIYEGKCYVSSKGWSPQEGMFGADETTTSRFKIGIPADSREIIKDDIVTILASDRNPNNIGKTFVVKDIIVTTFSVEQSLLVVRFTGRRPI